MCKVYNFTLVCNEIIIKADDTEKREEVSRSMFVLCPLDEFCEGTLKQVIRFPIFFHFTVCSHPSI